MVGYVGRWSCLFLAALVCGAGCGRIEFTSFPSDAATADSSADAPDAAGDAHVDASRDVGGDSPIDVGGDTSFPPGSLTVTSLATEWATEASVYWSWTTTGDAADFGRFELVTGPTRNAVRSRTPEARVWGPADNPELGLMIIPSGNPVDHTITYGHAAGETIFAQVTVFDSLGGGSQSDVVPATTFTATSEIVLFADADTLGYSLPSTFVRSSSGAYSGTHCYTYASLCGGEAACWENLRRQDIRSDLSALPLGAFDRAFYEFAIEITGTGVLPSYWSDVQLGFTSGNYVAFDWLTLSPNVGYRIIQVPLRAFGSDAVRLDHATATTGQLNEFWVGGLFSDGATVRFDEARIRW